MFEVLQTASYLGIVTAGSDLKSIVTAKTSSLESVQNFSDLNKWHLSDITSREGRITKTTIMIDRNTGLMNYYEDFNQGTILVDANGICEKIDASKKKF